ncbi:hypothetical protein Hypma_003762 [Hypsizygus marmoreus]|uniref:Uncharacterized protein n=1 Tax=Hypsizygus marmoreus TaxID=39966 RepID=A0A369J162_HYPMA|nr:hypothetical protein Hypma_003762 [Hypsizygus marmoreus]
MVGVVYDCGLVFMVCFYCLLCLTIALKSKQTQWTLFGQKITSAGTDRVCPHCVSRRTRTFSSFALVMSSGLNQYIITGQFVGHFVILFPRSIDCGCRSSGSMGSALFVYDSIFHSDDGKTWRGRHEFPLQPGQAIPNLPISSEMVCAILLRVSSSCRSLVMASITTAPLVLWRWQFREYHDILCEISKLSSRYCADRQSSKKSCGYLCDDDVPVNASIFTKPTIRDLLDYSIQFPSRNMYHMPTGSVELNTLASGNRSHPVPSRAKASESMRSIHFHSRENLNFQMHV